MSNSDQHVAEASTEDSELSFFDILSQLLARKWLIVIATFLGAIVGVFVANLPPDVFRARAVVYFEQTETTAALPEELTGQALGLPRQNLRGMQTEFHIIKSRLILRDVAEKLNLDWNVLPVKVPKIGDLIMRRNLPLIGGFIPTRYARPGDRLELGDLNIPADQRHVRLRIVSLGDEQFEIWAEGEKLAQGVVGSRIILEEAKISLLIKHLSAPAGREFLIWQSNLKSGISIAKNGLTIRQRKGSQIIDFTYVNRDRQLAKNVVNAVVASYEAYKLTRRSAAIDQGILFIDNKLPEIRAGLKQANTTLRQYRQNQQAELSGGTQDLLLRAVALEAELEELAFQEEQLAKRVTKNHPQYQTLLTRQSHSRQRLEDLRATITELPETEQKLLGLTEKVAIATQLERKMLERIEQLQVAKASTVSAVQLLEPADGAGRIGPDRRTPIIIGFIGGFLLAALAVLGLNFSRRGIDDAAIIETLGLPLFATIGWVPGLKNNRKGTGVETYTLAESDPMNLVIESLRGLRTGLQFSLATASSKSLLITSCAPSDGKSFVALNLATVWGQSGEKVLLIDADMRRGVQNRHFDLPRKPKGLTDFLAGQASLEDVVHHDAGKQIDFIPAGSYPPNPSELLASPVFDKLLQESTEHYDMVILDAAPALAVTDPGIIGQKTGMTLLAIRHMVTTATEVRASLKTLATSGVVPSGAIMTQFNPAKSRYGKYGNKYQYYGGYHYDYSSSDD
jgi:tyrosine-protein kinase Etk/Wzc